MRNRLFFLAAALLTTTIAAHADSVQTLGAYNGTTVVSDPGPYQPLTAIGTFNIFAGDTGATISGTFGNSLNRFSSGVDVYLGSVEVAQCVEFAACYNDPSGVPTPWSYTLTAANIAALGTGPVNFSVQQTSQFEIHLGDTTLSQTGPTAVTPEPSSLALLGTGLLGVVGAARRRFV